MHFRLPLLAAATLLVIGTAHAQQAAAPQAPASQAGAPQTATRNDAAVANEVQQRIRTVNYTSCTEKMKEFKAQKQKIPPAEKFCRCVADNIVLDNKELASAIRGQLETSVKDKVTAQTKSCLQKFPPA